MSSGTPPGEAAPDDFEVRLLAVFHAEGRQLIQRLQAAIADLEARPDASEARHSIARLLHSLKGSALAAGIKRLAEHVHKVEDSLDRLSPQDLKAALDQAAAMLDGLPVHAAGGNSASAADMLRLDSLQPRLQRLAVQTAEALGKLATLKVDDGTSTLPRAILDRLAAPLEHLVGNAVLHGIETPTQRLALGKPECGLITLSAQRPDEALILSLEDDGAGLDLAAIRAQARKQGLQPADDADEAQLARLIFLPGFSTAELSPLAGRGIGMSIVETETAALGGHVECDSQPGRGTVFRLILPAG
ncbi:MAG: hypothetical protein HGA47_08145 [Zoogloea sp.]|nr:hypothetical protein [Zoogloea sp.]